MLKQLFDQGQRDALAKFKVASLATTAKSFGNQTAVPAPTKVEPALTPPTSPAAPIATSAPKSQVLG